MICVMPLTLSRRDVLRLALASGAFLGLSACEGKSPDRRAPSPTATVEPDQPETWLVDTELFLAARERVHGYRRTLSSARPRLEAEIAHAQQLAGLWSTQQDTLDRLIVLAGMPLDELAEIPDVDFARLAQEAEDAERARSTAAPDREGSEGSDESEGDAQAGDDAQEADDESGDDLPAPSPDDTLAELGATMVFDLPQVWEELAASSPVNLPTLTSLAAQHAASAALLGSPVLWEPLAGPSGAAAVPLLAVTRPAIFCLEVLAARSRESERADYEAVLKPLQVLTRQLTTLAGPAAPVPPLGYGLPTDLDNQAARYALARNVVADIAPAALEASERVRGDLQGLTGVVRIVAESVSWAQRLESEPLPFPGMVLP